MTPESKAREKQRRIDQHRANSNKWHSKWASKGVPKQPQAADGMSRSAGSAGNAEAAGRARPEQPPKEITDFAAQISAELMREAKLEQQHDHFNDVCSFILNIYNSSVYLYISV